MVVDDGQMNRFQVKVKTMLSIDLYHNGKVEGEQGVQRDAESING